jgi:hypothetical protein
MRDDPVGWAARLFDDALPIIEARLHRKTRNLVAARDRGNEKVLRGMQEEVLHLTELRQRIDDWMRENAVEEVGEPPPRDRCPHGSPWEDCQPCLEAGDRAFDSGREQAFFGGSRGRD